MLRKKQRVGDACMIGTLPSSWSGALEMLWGSCPPGHFQIPPPQNPFPISQLHRNKAPTFLFVNHSHESLYRSEIHSAVNHT